MNEQDQRFGLITIGLDKISDHEKSLNNRREVMTLLRYTSSIVNPQTSLLESSQLHYLTTLMSYYGFTGIDKVLFDAKLKEVNPLAVMDNRICIIYRIGEDNAIEFNETKDIVGFMGYYYDETCISQILQINQIYVKKEYRRQGLATRLINALQSSLQSKNKTSFIHKHTTQPIIRVQVPLQMEALKLFYGCGFKVGRLHSFLAFDKWQTIQREIHDCITRNALFNLYTNPRYGPYRQEDVFLAGKFVRVSLTMVYIPECCHYCRKGGDEVNLNQCAKCKSVYYCSTECAKNDMKCHKLACYYGRV